MKRADGKTPRVNPERGQPVNLCRNVSVLCAAARSVKNARNRPSSHGVTSPARRSRGGETSSGDTSRESTRYDSDGAQRSLDFCVAAAGSGGSAEPSQRLALSGRSNRSSRFDTKPTDGCRQSTSSTSVDPQRPVPRTKTNRDAPPASGVATLAQLAGLHFLDGGHHFRWQALLPGVVAISELNALDVAPPA